MNDKTLVEWDLSPEEKATLLAHTKWTECPMCEGQPPRDKPDAFCVLCGNEGKVTNGTRDVTAHLRLSCQHSFERIEALQSRIEALEAALRDAAKAERGRIVAWLRDDARLTEIEARRILGNLVTLTQADTDDWAKLIAMKHGIADALESQP